MRGRLRYPGAVCRVSESGLGRTALCTGAGRCGGDGPGAQPSSLWRERISRASRRQTAGQWAVFLDGGTVAAQRVPRAGRPLPEPAGSQSLACVSLGVNTGSDSLRVLVCLFPKCCLNSTVLMFPCHSLPKFRAEGLWGPASSGSPEPQPRAETVSLRGLVNSPGQCQGGGCRPGTPPPAFPLLSLPGLGPSHRRPAGAALPAQAEWGPGLGWPFPWG